MSSKVIYVTFHFNLLYIEFLFINRIWNWKLMYRTIFSRIIKYWFFFINHSTYIMKLHNKNFMWDCHKTNLFFLVFELIFFLVNHLFYKFYTPFHYIFITLSSFTIIISNIFIFFLCILSPSFWRCIV